LRSGEVPGLDMPGNQAFPVSPGFRVATGPDAENAWAHLGGRGKAFASLRDWEAAFGHLDFPHGDP
jgi:hypothetical protein